MLLKEVGLQLYSLREETEKDFCATVEKVAKMGYTGVEFAGYGGLKPAALAVTLTHADGSEENAFGYLDPLSSVAAFGLRPGENDVEYVPVGDRSRSVIRVRWYDTFEGV